MAKGIALTIGLNKVDPSHYGGWDGELNACEYDANDMAKIAQAKGFSVTKLLTAQATREAVFREIKKAASVLEGGDIFMLSYSGHGGQVRDCTDDEPDNEDETWCLYDGQVLDDELYVTWGKFKEGVRILVFSDSCHSGSVTRMAKAFAALGRPEAILTYQPQPGKDAPKYKYMPVDVTVRTYQENQEFYDNLQKALPKAASVNVRSTVRLISGCQDNQVSQDGAFNGLFTGKLLQVWNDGAFDKSYSEFHRSIVSRMPPDQTPNHFIVGTHNPAYDSQAPFTI